MCPKCHAYPVIQAPHSDLRECSRCGHVWLEEKNSPAGTSPGGATPKPHTRKEYEMSTTIISQNQELYNQAVAMVVSGQVSRDGRDGQCFISTEDGLHLANDTACTCGQQPCPHSLACNLYNRARYAVETILERRPNLSIVQLAWIIEDDLQSNVTDPSLADKLTMCLAVCHQLHQAELDARRNQPRFQSSYTVSLAGLTRRHGQLWSQSRRERR